MCNYRRRFDSSITINDCTLTYNHIDVFAHDTKEDFNFKLIADIVYCQIIINEIYETKPDKNDCDITYHQKTNKIHGIISFKLKEHLDAHVILSLDDH